MSYRFTQVSDQSQLRQIVELQSKYLKGATSVSEEATEGFLTCQHDVELLQKMNQPNGHVIALAGEELAGFCLVMAPTWRNELAVIAPMFDLIETLSRHGRLITPDDYVVVGQVCVAKEHRRQGVFRGLYNHYREVLTPHFKYCITEVATANVRSLDAHAAVGFEIIHSYVAPDGISWEVVLWDWS